MGKELSLPKYSSSLQALKRLISIHKEDYGEMLLKVEVINCKTGNIDFDLNVKTTILFGSNVQKVALIWDECGLKNFKSLGLFGVYWVSYNEMEFDEDEQALIIKSSDSDKIVKLYA